MPRFPVIAAAVVCLAQAGLSGPALAAGVKTESKVNGSSEVVIRLHGFLTDEDLTMLRLVQGNDQALALFVPHGAGFAAIAAAPGDGFFRNGQPVASAQALAETPDLATAEAGARQACDQLRRGKAPCQVILTVAPKP